MPQTVTGLYVPQGGAPGSGYQAALTLPNPFSGTALAYKVGASFYEEVLSFKALFTTDGTASTRSVTYTVSDATGAIIAIMPSAGSQAASLSKYYNYTTTLATPVSDAVAGVIGGPPAPIMLQPNWTVSMVVSNIAAGDKFTGAYIVVNRIPTGVAEPTPLALVPTPIAL